jgi:hypothetical protein
MDRPHGKYNKISVNELCSRLLELHHAAREAKKLIDRIVAPFHPQREGMRNAGSKVVQLQRSPYSRDLR